MNEELKAALADAAAQKARADALEAELIATSGRADAAEGACDSLKAQLEDLTKAVRTDGPAIADLENQVTVLSSQVTQLKDELAIAKDPVRFRKDVQQRVKLQAAAAAVLGAGFNADSMTDSDILRSVLEKLHGPIAKDKSEEYLRARFDAAVEGYFASEAALSRARDAIRAEESRRTDAAAAHQKMVAFNRNRSTSEEK